MAVLIVNPRASRVTPALTASVARELERAGPVEVVATTGPWHARDLASEAASRGETVYVFSGDGGYNEALNGVGEGPIGFLPGGGTNVLPRALGLPRDPIECARRLAAGGSPRRISLGRVNGRRFGFAVGLGLDAAAVRAVDERGRKPDGRRPGDLAFMGAFARLLRASGGRIDAQIEVAGHGRVAWALISKGSVYTYAGPIPMRVAPTARFELGLDLVAPRAIRVRSFPRLMGYALTGRGQQHASDIVYVHDADRLELRADRPLPLQADGEDLGDEREVLLEAERNAVAVLVGGADASH